MSDSITITLAGKPYEIQQLTLAQLRDLSVGIVEPEPLDAEAFVLKSFDRGVKAIAIALREKYPEITVEFIYAQPINKTEFREAHDKVLTFSGIVSPKRSIDELRAQIDALQKELTAREKEDAGQGEAQAAAAAA